MPHSKHICGVSHGELSGWNTLILENDLLRVVVLPEKGSDIIEFLYKPVGLDYLWKSPFGLPAKPDMERLPHDQFMDNYEGGWQEILPSGGEASSYAGVEYGLHGESWSLPWSVSSEDCQPALRVSVTLTGRLTMLPLVIEKRLTLKAGEAILHVDETLTNESDRPVEFMWGHHPALGEPFLNGDCIMDIPAVKCEGGSVAGHPAARLGCGPEYDYPIATAKDGLPIDLSVIPPPSARRCDEFWLPDIHEGWVAVTDTKRKIGFGLAWDLTVLNSLWVWQEFHGQTDPPWNGECYVMAVEPWSSYPLSGLGEAARRNTQIKLQPRGSLNTWLKAVAYEGIERVARISDEGQVESAG